MDSNRHRRGIFLYWFLWHFSLHVLLLICCKKCMTMDRTTFFSATHLSIKSNFKSVFGKTCLLSSKVLKGKFLMLTMKLDRRALLPYNLEIQDIGLFPFALYSILVIVNFLQNSVTLFRENMHIFHTL